MPFKIVETTENGKRLLTTVPAAWERYGTLFWPKKNKSILINSEHSVPDKNWKQMPCVLKRSNMPKYETSEQEIKQMSDMSDTDQDVIAEDLDTVIPTFNFNELLKDCVSENISSVENGNVTQAILDNNLKNVIFIPDASDPCPEIIEIPGDQLVTTADEKLNHLLALATANASNIQQLSNTMQNIVQKLGIIDTKFEELISRIGVSNNACNPQGSEFKVITNAEELNNFENSLSDPQTENNLIKTLSVTCSKGRGRGYSNAYNLIDAIFSRKFMTQCSWAGGTRGEPKICFKAFTKTIAIFFKIIHESDNTFTKPDSDIFFKNIMRHSVKRNAAKLLRASAQKRRPKKSNVLQNSNLQVTECLSNVDQENIPVPLPLDLTA